MAIKSTKTFLRVNSLLGRLPLVRSIHKLFTNRHGVIIPDKEIFGIIFKTPVGLGADIDRNGDYIDVLSGYGFGHICIGPLTPSPQENDSEVPSKGIKYAITRTGELPFNGILAMDLCCNRTASSEEMIIRDYNVAFSLAYDFADFFILDFRPSWISSQLNPSLIANIADSVLETRLTYDNYKPVLLRLPSGMSVAMLDEILSFSRMNRIDGFVLSDKDAIAHIYEQSSGHFPIISAGMVRKDTDVSALLEYGADLVEISSSFVNGRGKFLNKIYKSLEQK